MQKDTGVRATLWATRGIAGAAFVLTLFLPVLLRWYCRYRYLTDAEQTAILAAFYGCALVTEAALWQLDRLLSNLLRQQVFVRENVGCIRTVQWCCGLVSLICLPAACIYYPLVFMVVIMAFLCLVVSVVRQMMDAAVTLREENDLTV